jgi:DNA-binding transcriptional ArsR family regulator
MHGYHYTARILKAMAHPVRLAILEVLKQDGECCVCHLEHALEQRQAYISQQLARLREAGLVIDRREGLNVFYALSDEALKDLLDMAILTAAAKAKREGHELGFEMIKPDHTEACPCPNCSAVIETGPEFEIEEGR